MLNNVDLEATVDKKEYEEEFVLCADKMGSLQRKLRDAGVPVIILFEGWHGSLRGTLINRLLSALDSRGYKVHSASKTRKEHENKPYFAQFWEKLPPKGAFSIYNSSWYYPQLEQEMQGIGHKTTDQNDLSYDDVNVYERQLTDDGYLVIKFFLHISQQKQKKNLEKLEKIFGKDWHEVNTENDWYGTYEEYYQAYEIMLAATNKINSKWHIVSAEDLRYAQLAVFKVLFAEIEAFLHRRVELPKKDKEGAVKAIPNILGSADLSLSVDREIYKDELKKYQKRLRTLQFELYKSKIPSVIVFEGWDASGKGGVIRRLTSFLDPLGYQVIPVSEPNIVEKQYHYLWRFWRNLPRPGEITIFDRSWYGRVLVERVEGFADTSEWQRAYREINETEEQWVKHGVVLAKFWLQIDKDEQYQRFEDRENNPNKVWKITKEDWRNREKWDEYEMAVNEMLFRTSTDYAPWIVVEANSKYYARLKVLSKLVDLFEKALDNN